MIDLAMAASSSVADVHLNLHRLLYGSAIFLSSTLLFLSQPMLAKVILPWFGGAAGVWITCMLFFQFVLLLGYLYAYGLTRYLGARAQATVHVALLIASAATLPVNPSAAWRNTGSEHPEFLILGLLAATIGLPYFVLSTTGPLLQFWYAGSARAAFPYRLFALSNLASVLALLAYPLGIEPLLPSRQQLLAWSAAYLGFVLLTAAAAFRSAPGQHPEARQPEPAGVNQPLLWIALAACASTLWLAVANHLSQEVAAIPFLWVLPLSLYLLSFILCFDRSGWYRPRVYRWILPAAWLVIGLRLAMQGSRGGFQWELLLFSTALFACCMFCHGELALRKPEPRRGLTLFYVMVATGGALGGMFVGLVAPRLFNAYLELPIGIAGCILLALALLYGYPSTRHLARLAVVAALAFVVTGQWRIAGGSQLRARNFYGTLQVIDSGSGATAVRALYNGTILHGLEFLAPEQRRRPTTYYGPQSGAGLVLASHRTPNRQVGVIGLGVGTLAAYGRAGDHYRFYEINPAVIQAASAHFHFLRQSEAGVDVVSGDGRLALEREAPVRFDVLILDAFSGDSIPVHLLTKQAFEIYFRRLRPGGIVAVHVTNKYLDLASVVQANADALHEQALMIHNASDRQGGIYAADWCLVAENSETLQPYQPQGTWKPTPPKPHLWTDDYSNLFQILK